MSVLLQGIFGLSLGYVLSSWIESFMHEHVSDALTRRVKFWKQYPRIFKPLIDTHYSHHTIHHVKTYKINHVTQFSSIEEQEKLANELKVRGAHGKTIIKGDFSIKLAGKGALVFIAPLLLAIPIIFYLFSFAGVIGGLVTLMLPPIMSHYVHPYLHRSYEYGQGQAPRLIAWVLSSRYGRGMYLNHFLHHRYGGTSNYNLVLGADWLRGKHRAPSKKDWEIMQSIGLPIKHKLLEESLQ